MSSETLCPGSCPPSPGLEPCAILISISLALTRYSAVTPNRAEAICLIALFAESPFGRTRNRAGSSPPSPVLLLPPIRFIAIAIVSCASGDNDPRDIAAVVNRFIISSAGSTSRKGIDCRFDLNVIKSLRATGSCSFRARERCL